MSATDDNKTQENTGSSSEKQNETKPDEVLILIEKISKELEDEKKKSSELTKRMLYFQADIQNLQKQSDRREAQAREDATLKYLVELISLKEDLERAITVAEKDGSSAIRDGISMIISRIDSDLRVESVERISVKPGAKFDPKLHEAVAFSPAGEKSDGSIISVVSNGYTFRGKVIKPTLVEVARQNLKREVRGRENAAVEREMEEQINVGTKSGEEN